jgi:hypothetical protein
MVAAIKNLAKSATKMAAFNSVQAIQILRTSFDYISQHIPLPSPKRVWSKKLLYKELRKLMKMPDGNSLLTR